MKRIKWFLLLWSFFLMPVHALRFTDGMEYETTSESTVTLTNAIDRDTLIVPDRVTYNSKTYAVTELDVYNLWKCTKIRKIVFPASFQKGSYENFYNLKNLACFEVDSRNPFYISIDGVLYSKDTSQLFAYPPGRTDIVFCLPPSVKTIKAYAFSGNGFLKLIQNIQFVESIEKGAFSNCKNLISVELHPKLRTIAEGVFRGCARLNSIQFPDSLLEIGNSAFMNSENLKKIELPGGLLKIGANAFVGCNLEYVFIPQHVQQLSSDAFGSGRYFKRFDVHPGNRTYCSVEGVLYNKDKTILMAYPTQKTESVFRIPNETVEIVSRAFANVPFLEKVYLSDSVQKMGRSCFSNCRSLLSIRLSSGLQVIEYGTFENCINLRSISIPKRVRKIDNFAFSNCRKLQKVTLPKEMVTIIPNAFQLCQSLKSIRVKRGNVNYSSRSGILYDKKMTELIKYPSMRQVPLFVIPKTVKKICAYSFEKALYPQTLIVPKSVSMIQERAFDHFYGLRKVVFEGYLNNLPNSVFSGCNNLKEVSLPIGLTEIPESAFSGCVSLQRLSLPKTIGVIGKSAFYNCSSLLSIYLPEKVSTIAPNTFENCLWLQQVRFSESLQSVQEYAFKNCQLLEKIQIPKFCSYVGLGAFSGCKKLNSVVLQNPQPFILLDKTFENISPTGFRIEVPKGSLADYKSLKSWSAVSNIVESNP